MPSPILCANCLYSLSVITIERTETYCDIPNVAVTEVPPPNRLNMLNTENISDDSLIQHQMPKHHVMRRIPQHMAYTKNRFLAFHISVRCSVCALLVELCLAGLSQRLENIDATPQTLNEDVSTTSHSHFMQFTHRTQRLLTTNMHSQPRNTTQHPTPQVSQFTLQSKPSNKFNLLLMHLIQNTNKHHIHHNRHKPPLPRKPPPLPAPLLPFFLIPQPIPPTRPRLSKRRHPSIAPDVPAPECRALVLVGLAHGDDTGVGAGERGFGVGCAAAAGADY